MAGGPSSTFNRSVWIGIQAVVLALLSACVERPPTAPIDVEPRVAQWQIAPDIASIRRRFEVAGIEFPAVVNDSAIREIYRQIDRRYRACLPRTFQDYITTRVDNSDVLTSSDWLEHDFPEADPDPDADYGGEELPEIGGGDGSDPCWPAYASCTRWCRRIPHAGARAVCFAGCMATYAACRAEL